MTLLGIGTENCSATSTERQTDHSDT